MKGRKAWAKLAVVLVAALLLALLLASPALAKRNVNPRVIPPHATPYGMSYADWSAKWWQWILAIPSSENPWLDATGENAAVGQSGPVFFLCGTMEYDWDGVARAERSVTVPPGKAIFLPIINAEMSPPEGWEGATWQDLVDFTSFYIDHTTQCDLSVDGRPLSVFSDAYRVKTDPDDPPSYTLPEDPVYPVAPGTYPFFSDGYWVMLAPLSAGMHTIHLHGLAPVPEWDWTFETGVTYHVTVR